MKSNSAFSFFIFIIILGIGVAIAYSLYNNSNTTGSIVISVIFGLLAILVSAAIKIAAPWDKAVVLRLGHFHALKGPGLFVIIPILDTIPYWVDIRVITTSFKAEKTLTKDTVPVDVDAVLFWKVLDPKKAAQRWAAFVIWAATAARA